MINVYYFVKINGFERFDDIHCNLNFTVREFLDKVEKSYHKRSYDDYDEVDSIVSLKDIHYVFLKGNKIIEDQHLGEYLDDLENSLLIITNNSTSVIENNIPIIDLNDYENLQFYSRGCSGPYLKAIDKKTQDTVLISTIGFDNKEAIKYLMKYRIVSTLDHCGIVKILGFRYPLNDKELKKTNLLTFEYTVKASKYKADLTKSIIVFEYVKNGSIEPIIKEYLESKGEKHDKMNPTIRSKIIYGIASIMKYVHHKKIIHRDLQLKHIYLDENFEPKISDFELAIFDGTDLKFEERALGTPFYMAPETFTDEFDDKYKFAYDVYSYGIILYFFFFSSTISFDDRKPYRSPQQYLMKICRGNRPKRPEHIPDCYWELIQRCWKQDYQERPTFEEICEILKHDKFGLEEYGMKTNLDELHEYQKRIDFYGLLDLIVGG